MGVRSRWVRWGLVALFGMSAAGYVLVSVATDAYSVPSDAMAPSVNRGDRILVWTFGHGASRGDVVVFRSSVATDRGIEALIKRVVAVGGDRISAQGGRVVVNGEVVDEPYVSDGVLTENLTAQRVPEGELFVLGDNRVSSADSRVFGPVPTGDVEGTLAAVDVPFDLILLGATVLSGIALLAILVVGWRSAAR